MTGAWHSVRYAVAAFLVASCARPIASRAPPEIRVLVYNIHAGKDAAGVDNLGRVADLVRETSADLVLLQEVDRGTRRSGRVDQPDVLSRRSGYSVAFGKTLDYDGGEYGIAVLSRWPIRNHELMRLPVEPPQQRAGGSYEPRGALRVTIAAPDGTFDVVNTHLDASQNDHYRRQEIRTILAVARAGRAPVLVGGDLNSTPESEVQADVHGAGLRDAWTECGRGDSLTYPADTPIKRIDYLYLTGTEKCREAMVMDTRASDHRPLFVTVQLR